MELSDLLGKGSEEYKYLRDIAEHIREMYHVGDSATTLSEIIDRIIPQVKEWQHCPLEILYTIVWIDTMHYKVRNGGKLESRVVYNTLAITKE